MPRQQEQRVSAPNFGAPRLEDPARMSTADDRRKAIEFDSPEFIPVGVSLLPATWKRYREELEELVARHPVIFGETTKGERDFDAIGGTYAEGEHVDAWGCVWSNIHAGCEAFVTGHPVPQRDMINSLQAPAPGAGMPHGFMFLRLTYLRGYEELMVDFAEEPPELQRLLDIVLEYNLGEVRRALEPPPYMMHFGDDLGLQDALPISPTQWRKHLKPCFAKIYGLCKEAGSKVYMHTDGHIVPIIEDLIECGVDVLNPQIRANKLENLVRECKGKVCVNLDLDRQGFPFWTPEQIDAHIEECVAALGAPEGGLWLGAECGPDVPLANIEALCQSLERCRERYAN
ncbi:MAG: hypothetical protein CO096_32250 [Armatimonadetes bacterium CG_4_9_14_3_um_filter_66_14]|nr:MAG: hypothetical protein CO096_32250 [Armatimonadetes bacterium CG_4_9_14_3_um_filter_66_14]